MVELSTYPKRLRKRGYYKINMTAVKMILAVFLIYPNCGNYEKRFQVKDATETRKNLAFFWPKASEIVSIKNCSKNLKQFHKLIKMVQFDLKYLIYLPNYNIYSSI